MPDSVPTTQEAVSDLDQHEVMARALQNEIQTESFWGKTLPPLNNCTYRHENPIRRSRERFVTPKEEVEEWIRR